MEEHAKLLEGETSHVPAKTLKAWYRYGWIGSFSEPICPILPNNPDPTLTNPDLLPITPEHRIFSPLDIVSLWIGMVVSVPVYYLAGGMVDLGMAWWQGMCTVVLASVILYTVLVLMAHPGAKYGLCHPVVLRAAFGVYGAHVPAALRGLVACGWYGIETWLGGQAVYEALDVVTSNWLRDAAAQSRVLGTSVPELACYAAFWLLELWVLWYGMAGIKKMEKIGAPVLVVLTAGLLVWAVAAAGGFGPMLAKGSEFGSGGREEGKFLAVFLPSLTACIGSWSTLTISIADFSRFAHSQGDQVLGQAIFPFVMTAFCFVGLAVTSATFVIYGQPVSNPIYLLPRIGSATTWAFFSLVIATIGISLAILTTNIAANIVAPINALVNLRPNFFTARTGALLVSILSLVSCPWKLLESSNRFIRVWLNGCSVFFGPIAGIVLVDYYVIRGRVLDIDALYSTSRSVNWAAMIALFAGVAVCVPGFLGAAGVPGTPAVLSTIYDVAWFVGLALAGTFYLALEKLKCSKYIPG